MADLHVVENAQGDTFVGFESDGVFIPVASVSAARTAQLVQRGQDLGSRLEDENDKAAGEADDTFPVSVKGPKSAQKTTRSSSSKGGES